jgi:long-chain acyl-CoA synthetase
VGHARGEPIVTPERSDAVTIDRIPDLVRLSATAWPHRIALQDAAGVVRTTYAELSADVERSAAALAGRGRPTDAYVAVTTGPDPSWLPRVLALMAADLVPVLVPPGTPPMPIGAAARAATGQVSGRRAGADTAVVVFTSGSTAAPRAVALSHDAILANLRSLFACSQATDDEALLSVLPPSHLYEFVCGQLAPIAAGARVVYAGAPLPNRLLETIRTQAITRALVVPALLDAMARALVRDLAASGLVAPACAAASPASIAQALASRGEGRRRDLVAAVRARLGASFRCVVTGGAAVDPAWREVLAAVGIAMHCGYGLSEAGPLVAIATGDAPRGSVGRPLPGIDVRIAGDGEVLVRSASVMSGYLNDEPASREALRDGWLHTGDRGRLDAEGFLFITGRLKESIVPANGESIAPEEFEVHYASPHFAEHCVVAVPDAIGNDEPVLVVVPQDGGADEIFHSLRAAAPARLRIGRMVVRDAPLPRTALGKVRRREIAAALMALEVA